ncbi:MAG: SDR family oxidoreductase [Lentisphaerae bacterium]|nr:MAG: SDR family oxidoreductase [Lentisphaerota bacterium]
MVSRRKVLVAGATGYLGQYLVKELKRQGYWIRALSRDMQKIRPIEQYVDDLFEGQATKPETIKGICKDIDIVVSSLGITRQQDGLSYMDVDYQGNRNILDEALAGNVSIFMYISVFNANKLGHLEIVKAKERFARDLKEAPLKHIIIRPNGFFSDMEEFFRMAQKGRIYLFGKGDFRANPIHGADLAQVCVQQLVDDGTAEIDVGGPEVLSQNQIALQAFEILGKTPRITHIPLWLTELILKLARTFTSPIRYGPIEFFLTVLTMDMIAPQYGQHTLEAHFRAIHKADDG